MAGSTVSGGIWRANYGEITEIQQFRLGPVSGIGWDATLPISQLTDLASILSTVGSAGMDVIVRGTELQAWKETDGFFTDIVVGPRLDSGKPAQIFRFFIDKLSDLLYVLNLLMADIQNTYPDDWDFSTFPKAVVVGPGGVIDYTILPRNVMDGWYADAADLSQVKSAVTDLESLTSTGRLSQTDLDNSYASKATEQVAADALPRDEVADAIIDEIVPVEVARNRIFNPALPGTGVPDSWFRASGTQPLVTWNSVTDRLRWEPTSAGTNTITGMIEAEPGELLTVSLDVICQPDRYVRIRLLAGADTGSNSVVIALTEGATGGDLQRLTVSGVMPEGYPEGFRFVMSILGGAGGWVEWCNVTTAGEVFDGNSVSENFLERYRWLGAPYRSISVHERGLVNTVMSDDITRIEVVDTLPASNPDFAGTIYLAPATRYPIFTDFLTGLTEITPRWNLLNPWTSDTSKIVKPTGLEQRTAFSLNAASYATDSEILTLSATTEASGVTNYRYENVHRGEGPDEGGAADEAIGIRAGVHFTSGDFTLRGSEYRGAAGNNLLLQVPLPGLAGLPTGTFVWVRSRVQTTMLYAKAWKLGDPEPSEWQLVTPVTLQAPGWVGFRAGVPSQTEIDRMGVSFTSDRAPGAY